MSYECVNCGQRVPLGYCHRNDLGDDVHVWCHTGQCHCGERRRCCAMFKNGKRCKRASSEDADYCAKHAKTMALVAELNKAVVDGMKKGRRKQR